MKKNVIVIDEQGNEYEATYPKRAKGLVKSGRARFVDENKICLACPPNINLEDNNMTEDIKNQNVYSIEYIISQIEKIAEQTEHLHAALEKLSQMGDGDSGGPGCPGNIQGQAKAHAISDIVKSREATNQRLISLYEKMYDDLKPTNANQNLDVLKLDVLDKLLSNSDYFESENGLASDMLDTLRQIFRENFQG